MRPEADYTTFLRARAQHGAANGFDPVYIPDFLYDFQKELVDWAIRGGRRGIFADCGLGKTPMQLAWADNVVRHTNKSVLIATPLAVSYQLLGEAEKFGFEAVRVSDGKVPSGARIVVTNYERLDRFDPGDFGGMVCDESSILKNFNGSTKAAITEFMRTLPYRLLCTATAAPNDYTELGTSSEALGELGHMDMLSRYFRNDLNHASSQGGRMFGKATEWRFKGHAEESFWRWVSSWARAIRKPSDYGYDDGDFVLPKLIERDHEVSANTVQPGMLFDLPALTLAEQREERRRTLGERCDKVTDLTDHKKQSLVWCHLNDEGNRLSSSIDGAVQVKGSDHDDEKEERLLAFQRGEIRVLVTKPKIGAWGLNLQGCSHVTWFPSHSFEQYYQGVRRCYRFGQKNDVMVDVVRTHGEERVLQSQQAKAVRADSMFTALMRHMTDALEVRRSSYDDFTTQPEVPSWL